MCVILGLMKLWLSEVDGYAKHTFGGNYMKSIGCMRVGRWAVLLLIMFALQGCTWFGGGQAADLMEPRDSQQAETEVRPRVAARSDVADGHTQPRVSGEAGSESAYGLAEMGYMRPNAPITYKDLAQKLGVEARGMAQLNFATEDDEIAAGELVIVPFGGDEVWRGLSDEELLKVHSTAAAAAPASWSGKLQQKIQNYYSENQLASELQYALQKGKSAVESGSKIAPDEVGIRYARLASRAIVDATVEEVRELPWVKTVTVEYKLPMGGSGSLNADALVALHELDDEGHFVFSQVGGRYKQDRFIGNLGFGYRHLSFDESWLWGVNGFLDYDFMGSHSRGGIGAEIKTDLLDVYSNYYLPLSPWKKAYKHEYLEERAAEGFDFGVTGRLPFLRSVDWKTRYYKWYGKNVDVYGDNKYLSSPDGIEFGAKWTPWKAVSLGLTHSRAIGTTLQETRVEGQFSFYIEELDKLFDNPNDKTGVDVRERVNELVSRQHDIVYERRVSAEGQALGIVIVKFERE